MKSVAPKEQDTDVAARNEGISNNEEYEGKSSSGWNHLYCRTASKQFFRAGLFSKFPAYQYIELKEQPNQRIALSLPSFKNLFLMLANDQRSNITATEINARYEEKLVMLGPVLQQFNSDGLDPFIDLSFDYHLRRGSFRLLRPKLEGTSLKN